MIKLWDQVERIWQAVIRPPRDEYYLDDLGPSQFYLHGQPVCRTDFSFTNKRNQRIECSHFEPENRIMKNLPCVIYLHGNCSSRLEALGCIPYLLPLYITLVAIDLSGSGLSEGEIISLGYFEKDDVAELIDYLREERNVSMVGLWGRSMGAVTAVLHCARDPTIGGIVCDSPFATLRLLADDIIQNSAGVTIPKFLTNAAVNMLRSMVLTHGKFDIDQLDTVKAAQICQAPAMFISAINDELINGRHGAAIARSYGGQHEFVWVDGDHNTTRSPALHEKIALFLYKSLQCDVLFASVEAIMSTTNSSPPQEIQLPTVTTMPEDEHPLEEMMIPEINPNKIVQPMTLKNLKFRAPERPE